MEEREEKLSKAREKLDRFRKKKNKPVPVSGAGEEERSTVSSPLNTPSKAEDPQQQPQQEETTVNLPPAPVTEQQQPPAPEPVVTPGSAPSPQHQEADLLSSSQPPVSSSSASSPFELLGDPPPLPQHTGAGAGAQGLAAYFGSSSAASSGYSDPSLQMDLTGEVVIKTM